MQFSQTGLSKYLWDSFKICCIALQPNTWLSWFGVTLKQMAAALRWYQKLIFILGPLRYLLIWRVKCRFYILLSNHLYTGLDIDAIHCFNHSTDSHSLCEGYTFCTAIIRSRMALYLVLMSKPRNFCSLRKHTGHRNKDWLRASSTDLLSFIAQLKKVQCLSPNKWHVSWLAT